MIIENPSSLVLGSFESEPKIILERFIYFLWFRDEIVYIGKTVNVSTRVEIHKKDKLFDKFTYQSYPGISDKDILKIERENINHYKPIFNGRANNFITTEDFCYLRENGIGRKLMKGEIYTDKIQMFSYYYDGASLHSFIKRCGRLEHKIDSDIHKTYDLTNSDKIEIVVENNIPRIEIIIKIRKPRQVRRPELKSPIMNTSLCIYDEMPFGKYSDKTVLWVMENDRQYMGWFLRNAWKGFVDDKIMDMF